MKASGLAGVALSIVTVLMVLALVVWDIERAAPGPLSPTHAADPALGGAEGCAACHGARGSSMAQACASCHEEIGEQLTRGHGFHGSLEGVESCATCHLEHHGEQAPLVGDRAFLLAGVETRAAFDHGFADFALVGRHDELDCAACHERADLPQLASGQSRFLGLDQDCSSCHADPHEGRFERGCQTCHGQQHPFEEVASFVHGESFPLVGAHGRSTCVECHAKGSTHSVEALAGLGAQPPARDCAACHESPHREPFVEGVGRLAATSAGNSCALCHDASHESFGPEVAALPLELHAASGFPLEPPHADLTCAQCHDSPSYPEAGQLPPPRSPQDCAACHADPHAGQFSSGPFAERSCADCHGSHGFEPSTFDLEQHALSAFPLEEAHATVRCEDCHPLPVEGASEPRLFAGAPTECAACHEDPHGGQFDRVAGRRSVERDCAECHGGHGFEPSTFDLEQHALTAFPLEESHAEVRCEACHAPSAEAALPRVFVGTPAACDACHDDVHDGVFVARRPSLGCAECHLPTRFAEVDRESFEHGRLAAFPLTGAHARARCESCHVPRAEPDAAGRAFGRVAELFPGEPERCETCHFDVHRGAFDGVGPERVEGRVGCARCHTTEHARDLVDGLFEHGAWTGFELDGAHDAVQCSACHGAGSPGSGRTLGFVSEHCPGDPASCVTCHDDVHAGRFDEPGRPLRLEGREGCARCHTSQAFDRVRQRGFDHGQWTGWELEGPHARSECAACHVLPSLDESGRPERRLGLVRGSECADCHADPHVGQFAVDGSTDCARCHPLRPGFVARSFDHDRDSRFPIDKAHLKVECSECHKPWPLPDGGTAVRYKPLGTQCADCHAPGEQGGGNPGGGR